VVTGTVPALVTTFKDKMRRYPAPVFGLETGWMASGWGEPGLPLDRGAVAPTNLLVSRIMTRAAPPALLYRRPALTAGPGLFTNLLVHAPGLNTTEADVLAVLETEAVGHEAPHGQIDPTARALIEKARQSGWQRVTFVTADGQPLWSLLCDGGGRFTWERTLSTGLKEQVIGDGRQLWHLYPELGLAARRALSRFQTWELAALAPWVLPSTDDLARGADVKLLDNHTVAIVPRTGKTVLHLTFGADDRLSERRLVEREGGRELAREACNVGLAGRLKVEAAAEPSLTPDTRNLLVMSLPIRTLPQVMAVHPLLQTEDSAKVDDQAVLARYRAEYPQPSPQAIALLQAKFQKRPNVQRGLTVLLATAATPRQTWLTVPESRATPIQKYFLGTQDSSGKVPAALRLKSGEIFLGRLQTLAELCQRWLDEKASLSDAETKQYLEFVGSPQAPLLTWLLLERVLSQPAHPIQGTTGSAAFIRQLLDQASRSLDGQPVLRYAFRYELACLLHDAGQDEQARRTFLDAYRTAWRERILPPLDQRFRQCLSAAEWKGLIRESARELLERQRWFGVLSLARQCAALGDPALADSLVTELVQQAQSSPDRVTVTLEVVEYHCQQQQHDKAMKLLDQLLSEPVLALRSTLWRLRAWLETEGPQSAKPSPKQFDALEKALDLEYRESPETIDLAAVRRDYGQLLEHYQQLAEALTTLQQPVPRELVAKVMRTADRWRSLDLEAGPACQAAAKVLRQLGQGELAWDYLTTPLRPWTPEQSDVLQLARALLGQGGDGKLSDQAFRLAVLADPSNYDIFWERVTALKTTGHYTEARTVLSRFAESEAPLEQRERVRRELNDR
jgi:tetratricopeptide (TPR) repeat protein